VFLEETAIHFFGELPFVFRLRQIPQSFIALWVIALWLGAEMEVKNLSEGEKFRILTILLPLNCSI
jgi:hypothetical protein